MIEKVNPKWKTVTAYYACYNSVYAVMMKIGIKCEIHDCTIAAMELLGFNKKEAIFLELLKKERVDVQYYLKTSSLAINKDEVLVFLNKCKEIIKNTNDDKINKIRKELQEKLNYIHKSKKK